MSGSRRSIASLVLALALAHPVGGSRAVPCAGDGDCGPDEHCVEATACAEAHCSPGFTLPIFPIAPEGEEPLRPYTAPITAVLDHAGSRFYTNCCESEIVAFTGEQGLRSAGASGCPFEPEECGGLFGPSCICSYRQASGDPFVLAGNYSGVLGSTAFLTYDGHAGYDFTHPSGTPIVAPRAGSLCKAVFDNINSTFSIAWDRFHTFYIDHGVIGSTGWATWFLHAEDLAGEDLGGNSLAELATGACAPVEEGQLVATVGNVGTFLPHLHFEVRRYPPDEGPESAGVVVVDPYGWRGAGADPIAANPQARPQESALWEGCGNRRLECGEECDDGNALADDGCSAECRVELPEPAPGLLAAAALGCLVTMARRRSHPSR